MKTALSRRNFLLQSVAVAATGTAAAALIRPSRAAEDKAKYGGLPMGIQSYSLRKFNLTEALRHIEGLGLHHVEFYGAHYSPGSSPEQIEKMNELLAKAKLKISAHGVNAFTKDHAANRRMFEFAKRAGIRNITADPTPDSFDSLDKLVAEYKIRICIHNHGPGARYDGLDTLQRAVKGRHKWIGACVDTGHVIRSGQDPVKWLHGLGKRVFALHIKDVEKPQKRTHDVVIGSGHLDVVALFKGLRKIKFPADGSISLEYESNPNNPIDDIRQCLAVAEKAIAKAG